MALWWKVDTLPSYNGQSTYPHVGYPHEKQSLNKLVLTIVVPLICGLMKSLFLMGVAYSTWG